MGEVILVKTKDEFDGHIKRTDGKLVVVDFYADWCGPCRMIAPKLQEMAKEFTDVAFIKVNVDESEDISSECKISAMPTFKFYKNGEEKQEVVGASEAKIREAIQKLK